MLLDASSLGWLSEGQELGSAADAYRFGREALVVMACDDSGEYCDHRVLLGLCVSDLVQM